MPVLTTHVKERFVLRTTTTYKRLTTCRCYPTCPPCVRATLRLQEEARSPEVTQEIVRRLKLADDSRAFLNDTQFMDYQYRKYGFVPIQFLVHEDIIFIVVTEPTCKVVVTCINSHDYHPARPRRKFRKKTKV